MIFVSFIIAYVGIQIQFGKRIEQKENRILLPNWIQQKEVEFMSGNNKLKGYYFWNRTDKKTFNKIIVLVHGYGLTHKDYFIEIEEFAARHYLVFAYDMTGCGLSQGKKIGGFSQFLLDAQSAVKYLLSLNLKLEIDIMGHSTGAFAVAALLNTDDLGVSKAIIVSGFNHPSSYVRSCMQKSLYSFSYLIQMWIYIVEIIKYGKIARYTGIDGINHFSGKTLIMQSENDDMVSYTQSLYSHKDEIKNDKVSFWLNKKGTHYPTRTKYEGKDIVNKKAFYVIEEFLSKG
ncbi:alpha/beta hydrolase family protein [Clostridium tyrobutyricum]|uniref:alpha/beta hydrolase family protein n=1 Tax=Clostridium tyrobutyricum TaxID=1519 RepID=UPI0020CB0079|nr:alpha/beta fold hydrolase [Clostridium tyrobutyricum]